MIVGRFMIFATGFWLLIALESRCNQVEWEDW
jgi:hypothetical protein